MNPPTDIIDDLRLLEAPVPFRVNYWVVAAVLAALVVAWWLLRRWSARRALRAAAHASQQAHVDALAELERLFTLIDSEQSRPYAIESSAIIRRYIEARFDLSAPLRSTEEFLSEAQHSPRLGAEDQALLAEFLQCCDLLKFAKTFADRGELQQLHDAAIRFVKDSRPARKQPGAAA